MTVKGAQKDIGVRFIDGLVFLALGMIGCRWQPGEERGAVIAAQMQRCRTEHYDGRSFGAGTEQRGQGPEEEVISQHDVGGKVLQDLLYDVVLGRNRVDECFLYYPQKPLRAIGDIRVAPAGARQRRRRRSLN